MTGTVSSMRRWLDQRAGEPYAYLTTIGRRTGRPHRIEIWFAVEDGRMYLMSGGRDRSDWLRNIQENPRVAIELGDATVDGIARIVEPWTGEDARARDLLVEKYATHGNPLDNWKRRSLPVVIEFPDSATESLR